MSRRTAGATRAPGTYKGFLHKTGGAKIPGAPVTIKVKGQKVTISSPKTPLGCPGVTGALEPEVSANTYKGVIKGNAVKGVHQPNKFGGYWGILVDGKFANGGFSGKFSVSGGGSTGQCRGEFKIRAKR